MSAIPANHQKVLEYRELVEYDDNILTFPTLYAKDKKGKSRVWTAFLTIEDSAGNTVAIEDKFWDRQRLPDGYNVYTYVEYGMEGGKITTGARTLVKDGKNLIKKNFTTPFTQAMYNVIGDFEKHVKDGYTPNKSSLLGSSATFDDLLARGGDAPWRVFGMALGKADESKIEYPIYVQEKLDGTRAMMVCDERFHKERPGYCGDGIGRTEIIQFRVDMYSRGREPIKSADHIIEEIWKTMKNYEDMYLDGEIWAPGYNRQDVSGRARRDKQAPEMEFHIFDCFYIGNEIPYHDRLDLLDDFFSTLRDDLGHEPKYIKRVETRLCKNRKEIDNMYKDVLSRGLEGLVLRPPNSPYEYGLNSEIRSNVTLKLKPREDAEWPVIAFASGERGKEVGAILFACAENDENVVKRMKLGPDDVIPPLDQRLTFNVTPNWTYEYRYALYKHLSAHPEDFDQIKNKFATIQYATLSKDYLPQEPKMLRMREDSEQSLFDKWAKG